VLADLFGVINDHMEIMGPLLVGVAGAFAAFSIASWLSELKIVVSTVKVLNTGLAAARAAAAANAGTGLFSSIIAGATAATGAVVTLQVALDAIGIGLVIATIAAGFKHASDESKKFKKTVEGISDDIQDLGRDAAAFQAALDFSQQSEATALFTKFAGGAQNLSEKLQGSQADWDAFINRIADQGLPEIAVQSLNRLHSAYKDADQAAKDAAATEEATAATREESKKAIDDQSQALRDLRDAMDEALNKNLGVAESEVKLRDTLAGMSGQVAELAAQGIDVAGAFDAATNSFDLNTEAGRRGTDLVTGAISNFQGFEQAILGSGESAEEMQGQLDSLYNQMVTQTAQAFGITDDQAKAMLETFGLTPDKLVTDVDLKSEEATREADALATRLNNLPGVPEPLAAQINAAIQSGDLETADALLSGWEAKYRNDPPTVKVNVSVDYDAIREFDRNAANQFRNQRTGAPGSPGHGT
jgi:chromosome segregation ATPase